MNDRGEAAARWLEGQLEAMERELRALVEINSWTRDRDGGQRCGEQLRRLFDIPGVSARMHPSTEFADHLVFTTEGPSSGASGTAGAVAPGSGGELSPGSGSGPAPVALIGHLDTVFPPGKFEGYRVDGALRRGPGVLDMKSGLTMMAFIIKSFVETGGLEGLPPIRVVIVGDEEIGSPEGKHVLAKELPGCQSTLTFESGRVRDAIITQRKGSAGIRAVAHGVAAHAGNHHPEGKNAIWALARLVDRAQRLTDYDRGVTVNVGRIEGGQGRNTVPDQCEALIDVRFEKVVDGEATLAQLREAAAAAEVEGTRIELHGGIARPPMERTEGNVALMKAYAACAKSSGLGHEEAALIGGGSDASNASAMGIASIDGLGPRGKGFHTLDEQIEIATLVPKTQAVVRYLAALGVPTGP